jgi:hypothetical protein
MTEALFTGFLKQLDEYNVVDVSHWKRNFAKIPGQFRAISISIPQSRFNLHNLAAKKETL